MYQNSTNCRQLLRTAKIDSAASNWNAQIETCLKFWNLFLCELRAKFTYKSTKIVIYGLYFESLNYLGFKLALRIEAFNSLDNNFPLKSMHAIKDLKMLH